MSQSDWIKLFIGAILTACLTLGAQVIVLRYQHRKTLERDRIQEQWAKESARWDALLPRVNALKDIAGYLYTHLGGWGITQRADEIKEHFREFDTFTSQFAEYPDVQRAIWALQNTSGWILHEQGVFLTDEQRAVRQERDMLAPPETPEERDERERVRTVELPERYQSLLTSVNALLETKRPEMPPSGKAGLRRLFGRGTQVL